MLVQLAFDLAFNFFFNKTFNSLLFLIVISLKFGHYVLQKQTVYDDLVKKLKIDDTELRKEVAGKMTKIMHARCELRGEVLA